MQFKLNPWDQQRGESSQAFAAFRAYLELGPDRTFRDAYRAASGRANAPNVPGSWCRWIKLHTWDDRARLWDIQIAQKIDKGILKSAQSRGELMVNSLDQAILEVMAGALELIAQGRRYLNMPATDTEIEDAPGPDGKPGKRYLIKAGDAKTQRYGGLMLQTGMELAIRARDLTVEAIRDGEKGQDEAGEPSLSQDRAQREMEAWRADQRARVLAIPSQPPEPGQAVAAGT